MHNILKKEMKLAASVLSYLFIAFGLMFFLPGYPVLCGPFFVCLGIFQSFQNAREANDIVFSALLPIPKRSIVKGKFAFVVFVEMCAVFVMLIATLIRMTLFSDAIAYRENTLMNANLFALGAAFVIFGVFNLLFVRGFFKTAYNLGKPFVYYIIANFIIMGLAETLHHIPGLAKINAFGFEYFGLQLMFLTIGVLIYVLLTFMAFKRSCEDFENIDL